MAYSDQLTSGKIYRKQGKIRWAKLLQKFFTRKLLRCLTFKGLKQCHTSFIIRSLYNINKYSRKNFCGTVENCEKLESLAQQIFHRLRQFGTFHIPKSYKHPKGFGWMLNWIHVTHYWTKSHMCHSSISIYSQFLAGLQIRGE